MRELRKYNIVLHNVIPRSSPVSYRVSSDCKAEGIDRYGGAVCGVGAKALRFTTLHGVTRVCINKAPFGARSLGVYELPDVQPMRRRYINP